MTEQEWLACGDVERMLSWSGRTRNVTKRKSRLFAAACCQRIWPLLTDEASRNAVEVTQRFADGLADHRELETAHTRIAPNYDASGIQEYAGQIAAWAACAEDGILAAIDSSDWASRAAAAVHIEQTSAWKFALDTEQIAHGALLRHLLGNPFRPYPAPPSWPTTVVPEGDGAPEGMLGRGSGAGEGVGGHDGSGVTARNHHVPQSWQTGRFLVPRRP